MISKSSRTFIDEEGNKCRFSFTGFYAAIEKYRDTNNSNAKRITFSEIYAIISDNLNVSTEAVRNWRRGYNGPADIEIVKDIANILKCDFHSLLDTKEYENITSIVEAKTVNMDPGDSENDVLMSILRDLIEIMEDYSNKGFPGTFGFEDKEADEYYSSWLHRISLKIKKNSFFIKKNNFKKIETLYMETRGFLEHTDQEPIRWTNICPYLAVFTRDIAFHEIKNYETLEDMLYENNIESQMFDDIANEIHPYGGFATMWDTPVFVLGMMMGSWYLSIVRHDFPELFVD